MNQFGLLYADPCWEYRVYSKATGRGRSAESHYPTLPIADLMAFDVAPLMLPDSVALIWCTWPTILDGLALGAAWGFAFKTCGFLWAKMNESASERWTVADDNVNWFMGMGHWTRANTEPCLLFTKGSPKRLNADVRQFVASPIQEHSRKPDKMYGMIERLVAGPYLEMFARRKDRAGWSYWGNEIVSDVEIGVRP